MKLYLLPVLAIILSSCTGKLLYKRVKVNGVTVTTKTYSKKEIEDNVYFLRMTVVNSALQQFKLSDEERIGLKQVIDEEAIKLCQATNFDVEKIQQTKREVRMASTAYTYDVNYLFDVVVNCN